MNPEDFTGTERLSEVFLDRFDIVYMNYPETNDDEITILKQSSKTHDALIPDKIYHFVSMFIRYIREDKDVEKKPSVRAGIGLIERAAAHALLQKRKTVKMNENPKCSY